MIDGVTPRAAGNRRRGLTLATGLAIAGLSPCSTSRSGRRTCSSASSSSPRSSPACSATRATSAIVGVVATLLIALSAAWNDDFGEAAYLQRLIVCVAITFIAAFAARNRQRTHRDRERFAVLAATAEIADGTRDLAPTVTALNELLVPTIADICIVDAMSGGEIQRLAVRAAGPRGDDLAADFRRAAAAAARGPAACAATVSRRARRRGPAAPHCRRRGRARAAARGAGRLGDRRAAARPRAAARRADAADHRPLAAPLRCRGTRIRPVLAGRAALALDNAGLFAELETIEAQLTAVLSTLAEAVTVQHTGGALVYANEAAARMLGYDPRRSCSARRSTRSSTRSTRRRRTVRRSRSRICRGAS